MPGIKTTPLHWRYLSDNEKDAIVNELLGRVTELEKLVELNIKEARE